MSEVHSNIDAVSQRIASLIDSYNFTRKGGDKSLGHDMAVAVANRIRERSVPDALSPSGDEWPANEPKYADRKRNKYDADQPNLRTGQMLSLESLLGKVTVTPEKILMQYGTGTAPSAAGNGTTLTTGDSSITDIEKAYFCSKTRPFYALDEEAKKAAAEIAAETFARLLEGV